MIEAIDLTKRFNDFTAVDHVSLSVEAGQLLALLGPNGAGKTTTVRMLSAILKPSEGQARINGFDVVKEANQVRKAIGMLTEQPGLYTRSTGMEYLLFFGRIYGMEDSQIKQRGMELFDRFGMPGDAISRRLGEYSKGMRQKVGIIRAMLHQPYVLLLDEPTSAMDPHSAKLVRDSIQELRDERRAIIVCTHNLAEAELLADRIAIIYEGRIIAEDNPSTLKRQLLPRRHFQMHLDRPIEKGQLDLDSLVQIDEIHHSIIHYSTDDPQKVNPALVRQLDGLGYGVVSLVEDTVTLEEVYLSIVQGQEG